MAKAPKEPTPTHYRLRVKAPIVAAGTQFNPGIAYTVKASVFEQIKTLAIDVAPIIKE